jgi:hypothetical protein
MLLSSIGKSAMNSQLCRKMQCFGSGFFDSGYGSSISGWSGYQSESGSGSRVSMTKNGKNLTFFLSKIGIHLSLGLHKWSESGPGLNRDPIRIRNIAVGGDP